MFNRALIKIALFLMVALLLAILAGFYFFPTLKGNSSFSSGLIFVILIVLSLSIIACSIKRVRFWIGYKRNSPLRLANLGSILFHFGMVLVLICFGVSFLMGMRGKVMLPEGVAISFPAEITILEQGRFHVYKEYAVGLNKVFLEEDRNQVGQVISQMDFFTGQVPQRLSIEINKPAKFLGYYWRSMNWGYSAHLKIYEQDKIVLDDYVNIATHQDGLYYDRFTMPGLGDIEVRFLPEMSGAGQPVAGAVLPKNTAIGFKLLKDGEVTTEVFLSEGQSKVVNDYRIEYSGYRLWEEFDVSRDPGEVLIYLGGLIAVVGLFLRIFLGPLRGVE